ncbi:MAG: methyltransferase domain-containing protein [Gammaproteobacteria bacterium]|nr:methyltransferase domain-containing protein [Gammaproteobacteria bacterium]
MPAIYDEIGKTYTVTRAADPRISNRLIELLNLPKCSSIADIGAGSGNYSLKLAESGFSVTAIEPSQTMRKQSRSHHNLRWHAGMAEGLPFPDKHFDGVTMILCLHHLNNWKKGLAEALRVVGDGPIIIFGFDVDYKADFWLFHYFPDFLQIDQDWSVDLPGIKDYVINTLSARLELFSFPLPKDLIDHFLAAGWARPEIYLEEKYRNGISSFPKLDNAALNRGLNMLQKDLQSNAWHEKYGHLLKHETHDRGYLFMKIQR